MDNAGINFFVILLIFEFERRIFGIYGMYVGNKGGHGSQYDLYG